MSRPDLDCNKTVGKKKKKMHLSHLETYSYAFMTSSSDEERLVPLFLFIDFHSSRSMLTQLLIVFEDSVSGNVMGDKALSMTLTGIRMLSVTLARNGTLRH